MTSFARFPAARCGLAATLAWACMAAAAPALAQPAVASGTPAALPPMQGDGPVRHVCGGIGIDESTAFRTAMKQHPLSLLFAGAGGDYQANVEVRISDAKGAAVLQTRAGGPVCLVDLPEGRYTVEARKGDKRQTRDITVGGAPKTADFRF